MSRRILIPILLLLALVGLAGSSLARHRTSHGPRPRLKLVADGFTSPLQLAVPPDGSGRRFVVDQIGVIKIIAPNGAVLDRPFLDVRSRLVDLQPSYEERGLMGLAFHPDYATNGRFFVYYTAPLRAEAPSGWDHTNRLAEFRVSNDPNVADADSQRIVLDVDHPHAHFNGGTVTFGPDGFLYLSIGDPSEPTSGNAQNVNNLLGKILRLDVNGANPYTVPADNPFVGRNGRDEIYAYGLRNPYRFSFDRGGSGMLVTGDAGQSLWEEHDVVVRGGNYGWHIREAKQCYNPADQYRPLPNCARTGELGEPLIRPVISYANAKNPRGGLGLVTIGGIIYRGSLFPQLRGQYIFGDWSRDWTSPSGSLFVARPRQTEEWTLKRLAIDGDSRGRLRNYLLSFGQDAEGEMYVLTTQRNEPSGNTGRVYKLIPSR